MLTFYYKLLVVFMDRANIHSDGPQGHECSGYVLRHFTQLIVSFKPTKQADLWRNTVYNRRLIDHVQS